MKTDIDFRQCLSPVVSFLDDLEETDRIDPNSPSDFRWTKLIMFASFLRKLVEHMDSSKSLALLPELEKYEREYLERNVILLHNIERFKRAHPNPPK